VKKYAEALTLVQHANIYLRETRSVLSTCDSDPITTGNPPYYPLTNGDFDRLEGDLSTDGLLLKRDWFAYNGGSVDADNKSYKKPLFFDIALNYVQLDMNRLQERAGKKPAVKSMTAKVEPKQIARAKVEEAERAPTPEPQAPPSGGLSSLLGGWWGRK
jgi:signal recognition particle subunit SRP68